MAKRLAGQCVEFANLKTKSGPLMTPICGALIVSPWRVEMLIASDLNSRFQRDLRVRGDLANSVECQDLSWGNRFQIDRLYQ